MSGEHLPGGCAVELEGKYEECGVFGIYAPNLDIAKLTYMGLQMLQHRGQEGAGIAISENGRILAPVVGPGEIRIALHDGSDIRGFRGAEMAMGHVRYGTHEGNDGLQPMMGKDFALGHNGHIVNSAELMKKTGINSGNSITDSRLLERMITRELNDNPHYELRDALTATANELVGAYSLVIMGRNKMYGLRDPHGFRPLVLGELPDQGWVLASEIPALDIVGAKFTREVIPGEIIEIDQEGYRSYFPFPKVQPQTCSFEFFYFSRPENIMHGQNVAEVRMRLGEYLRGKQLAEEDSVDADIVIGVPDTGTIAAVGYSRASGIRFEPEALVRNRYVGRNFITPGQSKREHDVRVKLNTNPSLLIGNRVVVVDDSIIRGTTTREIVAMLFKAGASEVHVRITSAPYMYPCVYGMATGDQKELVAADKSVDEICRHINANSLHFLSVERIETALGPAAGKVCMACMTGRYPTPVPQEIFKVKSPPSALVPNQN